MSEGELQEDINTLKEKIQKGKKGKRDIKISDYLSQNNIDIKRSTDWKGRRTLKGHAGKIYAMQWADDSTHVVSASQDGNLLVWNALTSNKVTAIPLRSTWVMTCAYAPGGQFVASGGLDNMCSIFNISDTKTFPVPVLCELNQHEGFISSCRFVGDSNKILTASGDKTCMLWDVAGRNVIKTFGEHEGPVMSVAVHSTGNSFIAATSDENVKKDSDRKGYVRVWDVRSAKCQRRAYLHDGDIIWVEYFPDENAFVTASEDGLLKLYDLRADDVLQVYGLDGNKVVATSASFSKSGKYLFSSYDDGRVVQWNTLTGQAELDVCQTPKRAAAVSVSPDGMAIGVASWDSYLRIFTGDSK